MSEREGPLRARATATAPLPLPPSLRRPSFPPSPHPPPRAMGDFNAVSEAFVNHYYNTFDTNRAGLASLYQDTSMLTFEGQQFQVRPRALRGDGATRLRMDGPSAGELSGAPASTSWQVSLLRAWPPACAYSAGVCQPPAPRRPDGALRAVPVIPVPHTHAPQRPNASPRARRALPPSWRSSRASLSTRASTPLPPAMRSRS